MDRGAWQTTVHGISRVGQDLVLFLSFFIMLRNNNSYLFVIYHFRLNVHAHFPRSTSVKNLPASAGDIRDVGSIPGLGISPDEGNGNPPQYSCLENPMEREDCRATVPGVAKSQTRLKWLSIYTEYVGLWKTVFPKMTTAIFLILSGLSDTGTPHHEVSVYALSLSPGRVLWWSWQMGWGRNDAAWLPSPGHKRQNGFAWKSLSLWMLTTWAHHHVVRKPRAHEMPRASVLAGCQQRSQLTFSINCWMSETMGL